MKINQNLKARLYKFYDENIDKGKSFVANHFLAEGCFRSTIYRHIRSRESGKQLERKKGSGRIPIISTPKNRARIAKMLNHKMKGSLRKAAKKFNCSHEKIRGILQKMNQYCATKEKKSRIEPPFSDLWLVQNVSGFYKLIEILILFWTMKAISL
jgi:hypothetical protein